jgi:S-adenosyl methyltransferase
VAAEDGELDRVASRRKPDPVVDPTVATEARVYDYLLGGTTNFEVDREVAQRQGEAVGGIDRPRAGVRANRVFLGEAVRYLVTEAGIRQFLDVGSGIPTEDNVHQVAQRLAPEARIVYVDNDPVVLAHAHELLTSTAEGAAEYVRADLSKPQDILDKAAATLDLTQPIGLTLVSMLHFFHDRQDPQGIVRRLLAAVPSGSFLVVSHITGDMQPELIARLVEAPGDQARYTFIPRTRDELSRFFEGLELVEPGIAPMSRWLPAGTDPMIRESADIYYYCAIGRKP